MRWATTGLIPWVIVFQIQDSDIYVEKSENIALPVKEGEH